MSCGRPFLIAQRPEMASIFLAGVPDDGSAILVDGENALVVEKDGGLVLVNVAPGPHQVVVGNKTAQVTLVAGAELRVDFATWALQAGMTAALGSFAVVSRAATSAAAAGRIAPPPGLPVAGFRF